MCYEDRVWYGRILFHDGRLKDNLTTWWFPPTPGLAKATPKVASYFYKRLFLWMPRKMWQVNFTCHHCKSSLRSKGIYNRVRLVLDVADCYYLAAEYMDCTRCKATYIAWDNRMLNQLPDGIRAHFPVVLTHKYACDISIVSLMRSRTLGNSSSSMQNKVRELHTEAWVRKQLCYLSDCHRHMTGREAQLLMPMAYQEALPFKSIPSPKWFLACYVRDVWSRLDTLQSALTAVFGKILKIDSTKKVTKKLQGEAAKSASWATSIGNEKGEILQCVLTTSESMDSLKVMANGLMDRFEKANVASPVAIYTDRDCCSNNQPSKFNSLFNRWDGLQVRLDIFHYMRRLAMGCTSESHPLYGTFMSHVSRAIFEWNELDLKLLRSAKKGELTKGVIRNPSDAAVNKAVTKDEMARHCRRRTRAPGTIVEMMEKLLLSLTAVTDSLGVPLLKEEMISIWAEQKRHVTCIQDPRDEQLYTITGYLMKGGVKLPVYRCARGSTSLESYHLHLARFIPGNIHVSH